MLPEPIIALYAARINEATAAETARRDAAYIDVPFPICGYTLRGMTLPDYITLVAAGNAHVTDQPEPFGQIERIRFWATHHGMFLWLLCSEYQADPAARDKFFARMLLEPSFDALAEGIAAYMRETFADAPVPRAPPLDEAPQADPYRVSFATHWIHELAEIYHWSRAELRAMPLKEFFQHLRLVRVERAFRDKIKPQRVSEESDRLWAEMLNAQNRRNS